MTLFSIRHFRQLSVFLLLGLASFVAARAATDTKTIVFFGDSLTAGYGLSDPTSEAYPALVQDKIDREKLGWRAVNAGLSGETTSGGLRRVDWILRQPIDVFVLALGGNDGLRGIDPSVSRENLQKILDRVRAKNPNVKLVLTGMQVPPSMGPDFTQAFERIFPAVAEKNHAVFVPFLLEGVGGRVDLNQPDRIHPTARGHAIIADTVWKALRPLL
jgi:acyl-CoA thioesterase-1